MCWARFFFWLLVACGLLVWYDRAVSGWLVPEFIDWYMKEGRPDEWHYHILAYTAAGTAAHVFFGYAIRAVFKLMLLVLSLAGLSVYAVAPMAFIISAAYTGKTLVPPLSMKLVHSAWSLCVIMYFKNFYESQYFVYDSPPGALDVARPLKSNFSKFMPAVKDQRGCGSCWAMSSLAVIEARFNMNAGRAGAQWPLSPGELIDCATAFRCNRGNQFAAVHYAKEKGVCPLSAYSYTDPEKFQWCR